MIAWNNFYCYLHFNFFCSAGVFGTTEILFRSQMRGLKVSEAIGCGFSCNGNAVAYLAGSPAPLNAYGLGKEQLRKKAFHERPGPSISSSYTTSLGFTIQVHKCSHMQRLDSLSEKYRA